VREEWRVAERLRFGDDELVPLRAGETIPWKLV
jgi:dihydroorotase